jgi:hypothetical protein
MEEWKTMHGRWKEGILHLIGTKHQVHRGLDKKYIFIYFEINIDNTLFLPADLLYIGEGMTCLLHTAF